MIIRHILEKGAVLAILYMFGAFLAHPQEFLHCMVSRPHSPTFAINYS
jgi:hypothetical protein